MYNLSFQSDPNIPLSLFLNLYQPLILHFMMKLFITIKKLDQHKIISSSIILRLFEWLYNDNENEKHSKNVDTSTSVTFDLGVYDLALHQGQENLCH